MNLVCFFHCMHKSIQIKFPCLNFNFFSKYISYNIFVHHNQITVQLHTHFIFHFLMFKILVFWYLVKMWKSYIELQARQRVLMFLFRKQSSSLNVIFYTCVILIHVKVLVECYFLLCIILLIKNMNTFNTLILLATSHFVKKW